MAPELRGYRAEDLPALVALQQACEPEHPLSADDWRYLDSVPDPRAKSGRLVLDDGHALVGYVSYTQLSMIYDPGRFAFTGGVAPGARGRGLGRRLYHALVEALAPHAPRNLSLGCWEQQRAGLDWLAALGYRECLRETESSLELADFDPAAHAQRWADAERAGFRLCSLAALGDTPARRRQIYALDMGFSTDIPTSAPFTPPDFAIYEHLLFGEPGYRAEHCSVALEQDEPVALCWHTLGSATPTIQTSVSGVRRDRRGRGLAMALKSRALAALKASGAGRVSTRNAVSNVGMLTVNAKLGYRPCGARIVVEKEMES